MRRRGSPLSLRSGRRAGREVESLAAIIVSKPQNLWPTVDPYRKHGADCRDCNRVSGPGCGAIGRLGHDRRPSHARGMGTALLLLPCHRPLGRGTNSWYSLRLLHGWRNRKSRRLARRSAVVVRASSFSWSADGEGFDATCQPDCQSDHVVSRSDVLRLSRLWVRSGHGARASRGACRSSCLHCSGRPERWPAIGGAARETTPKPGAPLAIRKICTTSHNELMLPTMTAVLAASSQIPQRAQAGEEEVGAAAHRDELRHRRDAGAHPGLLRN